MRIAPELKHIGRTNYRVPWKKLAGHVEESGPLEVEGKYARTKITAPINLDKKMVVVVARSAPARLPSGWIDMVDGNDRRRPQQPSDSIWSQIPFSSSLAQIPLQLRARKVQRVKQLIVVTGQLRARIPCPPIIKTLFAKALERTAPET
ncbi:hypothetical protein NHQ30_009779 [Ciborinia camelliae]|nr:hypothetical protein NHQ30_009779 [Ciborinia camelliae]